MKSILGLKRRDGTNLSTFDFTYLSSKHTSLK